MKTRSKLLLLACLPLLALADIVVKGRPHSAQASRSRPAGNYQANTYCQTNTNLSQLSITGTQPMPLNAAGYTSTSASIPGDSANFNTSGTDTSGNQFFRAASGAGINYSLSVSSPIGVAHWECRASLPSNGTPQSNPDFFCTSGTSTNFPLTGWVDYSNGTTTGAPVFTANAALVAPTGVTATPQAGLGIVINCTNASSQPSGTTYNLLESSTSGGEGTTPVGAGITLPYTQQETTAGTKYYILQAASGGATANSAEVSALAYNQQSGGSNVATGTAQAPAAGAVTALTGTLADNGTAPRPTLAWVLPTSGGTLTGLNVRRGTAPGGESATPLNGSVLAATATGFVDTTAAYATDYYYFVDSLSSGATVTSAELHIKTDTSRPSLTVTPGNGVNTLNITNGGGTLGVAVYRCLHGGSLALYITLPSAATSYPDTAAVNGVAYDYQVFDLD